MATWAKEQQNMYSLRSGARNRNMGLDYLHADYVKQQRLNTKIADSGQKKAIDSKRGLVTQ